MSQEDIKDYFYRLAIEDDLSDMFALPPVDLSLVAREFVSRGVEVPEAVRVLATSKRLGVPAMRVLPMGFSWAFHLAHMTHVNLATQALPASTHLVDKRCAPVLDPLQSTLLLYADNAAHIALSPEVSKQSRMQLSTLLNGIGLDTHEVTEAEQVGRTLGAQFDGRTGRIGPTPERGARLDQALYGIVHGMPIDSWGMRRVVGHITSQMLVRRPLLAVLQHVYTFINAEIEKPVRVWKSVERELRAVRGLMVYAEARL